MKKSKFNIRLFIQIFFFLLIGLISLNHFVEEYGYSLPIISKANLHALCPFGGVVSVYQYITNSTFVKKVHESSFILMYIVFFISILFGPVFCGWVCPLGSIQEWFGNIGKRIFRKKYNRFIKYKYDKYLRFLRYFVLVWVIYITAKSGILIFQDLDPYYALFNFYTGEVAISGILLLITTLIGSLFIERPWCKYFCPYGALLGFTNKFRIFKIRRSSEKCISCNICNNVCPMNIEVANKEIVNNSQCISCMECTSENNCPIEDTVYLSVKKSEEGVKNEG